MNKPIRRKAAFRPISDDCPICKAVAQGRNSMDDLRAAFAEAKKMQKKEKDTRASYDSIIYSG